MLMNKVNIANYVVYDLSNRFNTVEHCNMDNEIIGLVAENWHKKHFITGINKNIKHRNNVNQKQNFLI